MVPCTSSWTPPCLAPPAPRPPKAAAFQPRHSRSPTVIPAKAGIQGGSKGGPVSWTVDVPRESNSSATTASLDPTAYKKHSPRRHRHWADNLFCLACSSDELTSLPNNARVEDYHCPNCSAKYQLKSKSGPFGRRVQNSAYEPKMRAIEEGKAPHYAFLQYSRETWRVTDLFVIPSHFFSPAIVEKRPPLGGNAQRSGWVGSNILLQALAPEARLQVVVDSAIRSPAEARVAWQRFAFLATDQRARGGWGADVLTSVLTLQRELGAAEFTLQGFLPPLRG